MSKISRFLAMSWSLDLLIRGSVPIDRKRLMVDLRSYDVQLLDARGMAVHLFRVVAMAHDFYHCINAI